ncbi:hypothetical protein ACJMK2_019012 [Sinanodonta woodiana]|uniref:Autophagy-related protein 16 domain-containing protein n=1 Tax=Sinanodonta woodiana TaxID=1069815 RepID=A0ABD3UFG2_SINWO
MATTGSTSWKQHILHQLKHRNKRERHGFETLIQANTRLFDSASSLKAKNIQLTIEAEKLREENMILQVKAESGGGGGGTPMTQAFEQKLFRQQEELTELHRKKSESAQQIIDLNNFIQEKEREIQIKDSKLTNAAVNEQSLKSELRHLENVIIELEATNQMLKDEHQALQLAFTALEEKYRKAQEENRELVDRWLALKAKDADRINEENDLFLRQKQEKLERDLKDAATKTIEVPVDSSPFLIPPVCLIASLPNVAQCKFDAHEGEVNAIQWSPSGTIFATGGADRKIKLWDYSGNYSNCKGILLGSNAGITSIDIDAEESMLLAASNDFASRVWSLTDQRLRHTLTGHSGKVLAAKFLGESGKVVSGSHDRTVKIWDLLSKACVKTIFAGSSCNDLVTLHGTNIISGHFDKRLRFWDSRAENTTNEITLQGRISSLHLSPDRGSLLCCCRDDSLKVIDLRNNQVSHTLCADSFRVSCDWSRAVFSPDASYAMAGSADGSVFIWNIEKKKVEKVLKEHTNAVIAVSWHPSGQYILSADKNKRVIVWSDI